MERLTLIIISLSIVFVVEAQKPVGSAKLMDKLTTKPEFAGGKVALIAFLQKNIQYPQMERDNDIQGKVVLRFMVDTSGAMQDIQVLRKVSPGLDKEAIRVVKLMPKWKPGTYYKKPVPVYYVLPVAFRLQ